MVYVLSKQVKTIQFLWALFYFVIKKVSRKALLI